MCSFLDTGAVVSEGSIHGELLQPQTEPHCADLHLVRQLLRHVQQVFVC